VSEWSNFFIVGAPKAGTTSLYQHLKNIPQIFMSPVKEPNFFSITNIPEDHYLKPIMNSEKYLSRFNGVLNEKIFGEATTLYLSDPKTPNLILKKSPNAKILISLRDPVERLFSNHLISKFS